jgi:phthalate 4,5-dioxygenase oxygenase subunit
MFHFIAWTEGEEGAVDTEAWRKFCHAQIGIDVDRAYRKVRTQDNRYLQDRNAMRLGDFTGIPGIPNQDVAMWETMGPIADRTTDRLGASDLAIVEFRRIMVEAACRMRDGGEAIGAGVDASHIRSFEGIVAKNTEWRTLGETRPSQAATEASSA